METVLDEEHIGSFAPIRIVHGPTVTPITPASAIMLRAVTLHADRLSGLGVDWGSGTGCIAITLAKNPAVRHVIALELSQNDVSATRANVKHNGVRERVTVLHSDSLRPFDSRARQRLDDSRGRVDFVVANPPGSSGDDGFAVRRRVAKDVIPFLKPDGLLWLQISVQYDTSRIESLAAPDRGLRYEGVIATTDWEPFDLERPDLRALIEQYAAVEGAGGLQYAFGDPTTGGATRITATAAFELFRASGESPLTRWQVHGYVKAGPRD